MRRFVPVLALVAACAAPDQDRPRSAVQGATRVLAQDLSPAALGRRTGSLSRLPSGVRTEVSRLGDATAPVADVAPELQRLGAAGSRTTAIAEDVLVRRPRFPDLLWPSSAAFGQHLADGFDDAAALVGRSQRALPEIDDQRHRTDPHDDHPEKSWWQRLRRRLRL